MLVVWAYATHNAARWKFSTASPKLPNPIRNRAFLYAGVAFLVLNVIGQLFRIYPKQNLSRALILLGLGTVMTLGMVVFNLKREAILQRIRLIRADLAAWE